MKVREIKEYWSKNGLALDADEGFCLGLTDNEITGIMVSWTADLEAIEAAKKTGSNLMIIHKEMFFPPLYSHSLVEHNLSDRVTFPRVSGLLNADITVFRAHDSLHKLCIIDEFAKVLGLDQPITCGEGAYRYYELEPVTAGELAKTVRKRTNVSCVRVVGDMKKSVSRVVLLTGGIGIAHNPRVIENMLRLKPDVFISGETDDYPMYAVIDAGVPMIEVGHTESENPGLRRFADLLKEEYPQIPVHFHEVKKPWVLV